MSATDPHSIAIQLARLALTADELAQQLQLARPSESDVLLLTMIATQFRLVADIVDTEQFDIQAFDQRPPRMADLLRPTPAEAA
jgi:hypothetical protein